jgi:hypothetical protein
VKVIAHQNKGMNPNAVDESGHIDVLAKNIPDVDHGKMKPFPIPGSSGDVRGKLL